MADFEWGTGPSGDSTNDWGNGATASNGDTWNNGPNGSGDADGGGRANDGLCFNCGEPGLVKFLLFLSGA